MTFNLNLIISVSQFQDLVEIRDNSKAQNVILKSQIDDLNKELEVLKKRLEKTINQILISEKEIEDLQIRIEDLTFEADNLNIQNTNRKPKWHYNREIYALKSKIDTHVTKISNSRDILNATIILHEDIKKRVDNLNKQFETSNRQIETLNALIDNASEQSEQ